MDTIEIEPGQAIGTIKLGMSHSLGKYTPRRSGAS